MRAQPSEPTLARVEYEPGIVEEAVRLVLDKGGNGHDPKRLLRLRYNHRSRLDSLYQNPDHEGREAAFREHFWQLFHRLELDRYLPGWLDQFDLRTNLEGVLVQSAIAAQREGAEPWESSERRGEGVPAYLVIKLKPSRFLQPEEMRRILLPQLLMAADLLDPRFGAAHSEDPGGTPVSARAIDLIYEGIWMLSARARLDALGLLVDHELLSDAEHLVSANAGGEPGQSSRELVARLGEFCCRKDLMALARTIHSRQIGTTGTTQAAICPLCAFPTTDWARTEDIEAIVPTIRADFPSWSMVDGCCSHCAERYEILGSHSG